MQCASAAVLGGHGAAPGSSALAPHPIFELAFNPEEIKFRLAAVPVFAVVNAKSEFVLVAGDDPKSRQLGLFFFSREEAEALVASVSAACCYQFSVKVLGEEGKGQCAPGGVRAGLHQVSPNRGYPEGC